MYRITISILSCHRCQIKGISRANGHFWIGEAMELLGVIRVATIDAVEAIVDWRRVLVRLHFGFVCHRLELSIGSPLTFHVRRLEFSFANSIGLGFVFAISVLMSADIHPLLDCLDKVEPLRSWFSTPLRRNPFITTPALSRSLPLSLEGGEADAAKKLVSLPSCNGSSGVTAQRVTLSEEVILEEESRFAIMVRNGKGALTTEEDARLDKKRYGIHVDAAKSKRGKRDGSVRKSYRCSWLRGLERKAVHAALVRAYHKACSSAICSIAPDVEVATPAPATHCCGASFIRFLF